MENIYTKKSATIFILIVLSIYYFIIDVYTSPDNIIKLFRGCHTLQTNSTKKKKKKIVSRSRAFGYLMNQNFKKTPLPNLQIIDRTQSSLNMHRTIMKSCLSGFRGEGRAPPPSFWDFTFLPYMGVGCLANSWPPLGEKSCIRLCLKSSVFHR